jgi:4-amino-4-deoxy-L-arabinose transferase-like glycosyltransferase
VFCAYGATICISRPSLPDTLRVEANSLILQRLFDRFVDALTNSKRRDYAVFAALVGYLFVWTAYGGISKSSQNLNSDMTELIAWSRDLSFGFPKHPPFAAVVVRGWFAWFPIADWTYYLLAMLTATAALWIAWRLFADYLPPTKRIVGLCLLTFIPFFNFHALKFNVNTALMPLWALTTFWFLRSYKTCSPAYAALAGIGAAICMVTKYWSIFLLAGLAVTALSDNRRGAYFRSSAPWLTILAGIVVISPHVGWLQKNNFAPMQYAALVHGGRSFAGALWAAFRYVADAIAFVSVPIAVLLLFARPRVSTLLEMAWPDDRDRRLVAVAFWTTTFLLPILAALLWHIDINAIWTMSCWTLLPVVLLSSHSVRMPRQPVRWVVGATVAFPLAMLIAAPGIALATSAFGNLLPQRTQTRMLADQVEKAWRGATQNALAYVGGNADLAYGVVTYAHDRPQALPGLPEKAAATLTRRGAAFVCEASDGGCTNEAKRIATLNSASRTSDVELITNYFGIAGKPVRYRIFVVPPSP